MSLRIKTHLHKLIMKVLINKRDALTRAPAGFSQNKNLMFENYIIYSYLLLLVYYACMRDDAVCVCVCVCVRC